MNAAENSEGAEVAVQALDNMSVRVARPKDKRVPFRDLTFDRCFGGSASQEQLFEECQGLVESSLDGYNVCLFCFGQTGAGKTYTMFGRKGKTMGLVPRVLHKILTAFDNGRNAYESSLTMSIMELHKDALLDLLTPTTSEGSQPKLQVAKNAKGCIHVPNAARAPVTTVAEADNLLLGAQQRRHVSEPS